jgi:hypothetical protein
MSSLEFEVVSANGTYTGADGQEKTRWLKCGVVFKSDKGSYTMKLEAIPARRNENGELWLNLFVPKKKEQPAQQQGFRDQSPNTTSASQPESGFPDPDIPF